MKAVLKLLAIFMALIIALVVFYAKASSELGKRLDIGYGASTSSRLVQLEIGDQAFAIPQNYIWSRDRWSGGRVSGVNMHALLPNFEPYTDATKAEFEKPGWNRRINFLLSEHNMPSGGAKTSSHGRKDIFNNRTTDSYNKLSIIIREEEAPYGLKRLVRQTDAKSGRELYIGHKKNGEFYWAECAQDGTGFSPYCNAYLDISHQVYVDYSFSKYYLRDWSSIDDTVEVFFKQFIVQKQEVGAK